MAEKYVEVMRKILYAVETGGQVYGNCRYNDFTEAYTNSSIEYAITIGAGQWYGTEAKRLLNLIRTTAPSEFAKLDTANIGYDLDTKNWSTYNISKTSAKAKCIQKIIDSEVGHKCQDILVDEQVIEYMNEAKNLGVSSIQGQMMCANWRHQGGLGSVKRILRKTKTPYTLDNLYSACQTDVADKSNNNQVGDYTTRQEKVYKWIKQYYPENAKEESTMSTTSNEAIQAMLKVALNEVNYLEKKSNAYLDSKTDNAGYNNFTKYWRDVKPEWNGSAWCACYVSWVFMKAFGLEMAKKLLKHWPYVYCPTLGSLFTKHSDPEVGDIVIFYRNGTFAHTGIVIEVVGDLFYTVEGNASSIAGITPNGGAVVKKSYYNSTLPGTKFCRPNYSLVTSVNDFIGTTTNTNVKNYVELGDVGTTVKELQQKLVKLGFKGADGKQLTVDGSFGSNTLYALKAAQKKYNLIVDGKAGKNTIVALDNAIKTTTSVLAVVGNKYIKQAQIHLNNFIGANLKITGILNSETKTAYRKALQKALNADYKCNLEVDGQIGAKSQAAMKKYCVQKGSQGMLVTVIEIGMLLNKIDPSGVECPGSFGNGLDAAVRKYQKAKKLTVDGAVGFNTMMSLVN